MNSGQTFHLLR